MNQFKLIEKTVKANAKDPKFWVQIVSSLAIVIVLGLHYLAGVSINDGDMMKALVGLAAVISLWGSLTDNSIVKSVATQVDPSQIIKSADELSGQLDALTKSAKKAAAIIEPLNGNKTSTVKVTAGEVTGTPQATADAQKAAADDEKPTSGTIITEPIENVSEDTKGTNK